MTPGEFQAVVLEDIIPAANPSWHFVWKLDLTVQEKGETREGFGERGSSFSKEGEKKAAHSAHGKSRSVTQCSHESS